MAAKDAKFAPHHPSIEETLFIKLYYNTRRRCGVKLTQTESWFQQHDFKLSIRKALYREAVCYLANFETSNN
jgi:hypothetical protein